MNPSEQTKHTPTAQRVWIVLVILAIALGLRFWGIGKESFWIDEIFSVRDSEGTVAEVLAKNADGTHPPLFHLGLHFWRLALGDSEGQMRAYSALWSMVSLLTILLLALEFGGWRNGLIALILATVNPMHVYFAQEARAYPQATAVCLLGTWCLWRWMRLLTQSRGTSKWWRWAVGYAACASVALYTHYLSVTVLLAQGVFVLAWFASRRQWTSVLGYMACTAATTVAFLPWFLYVLRFRSTFYHEDLAWLPAPYLSDFYSFLGREMVWGYVKAIATPWWVPTLGVSLLMLSVCFWRVFSRRNRNVVFFEGPQRTGIAFLTWMLFGPAVVAGIAGVVYHTIYCRPRFAGFILPPFFILLAFACSSFRRRWAVWLTTVLTGGFMLAGTIVYHQTYLKVSWRLFPRIWRDKGPPAGAVFFPTGQELTPNHYMDEPIVPPDRAKIEWFLPRIEKADIWLCFKYGINFRPHKKDYEYYQWLVSLGRVHQIRVPMSLALQVVTIGEPPAHASVDGGLDRWFAPFDIYPKIEGFHEDGGFSVLEIDDATSAAFRWSGPKARLSLHDSERVSTVVLNVQLPPPVHEGYHPTLRVYAKRGKRVSGLFDTDPVAILDDYRVGPFTVAAPVPRGKEPLWIGWTVNTVNLAKAKLSADDRDLGLRVNWVGTQDRTGNGK